MTDFSDPTFWVPTLVAVVALAFAVFEWWRGREDRAIAKAMFAVVKSLRKDLSEVSKSLPSANQAEIRRREEFEWKKLRDLAKVGSWLYDRLTEE